MAPAISDAALLTCLTSLPIAAQQNPNNSALPDSSFLGSAKVNLSERSGIRLSSLNAVSGDVSSYLHVAFLKYFIPGRLSIRTYSKYCFWPIRYGTSRIPVLWITNGHLALEKEPKRDERTV